MSTTVNQVIRERPAASFFLFVVAASVLGIAAFAWVKSTTGVGLTLVNDQLFSKGSITAPAFNTGKAGSSDDWAFNFGNTLDGKDYTSIGGGSGRRVSGVDGAAFIVTTSRHGDRLTMDGVGSLGIRGGVAPGGQGVSASQLYGGSGAPKIVAPNSSLYMRLDGTKGSRLYINVSGPNKTGDSWQAVPSL